MAGIDHIVYASPDVEVGVRRIADLTGVEAVVGGSHVGRGTRNSLLTFDDRTYFEIIGIDHDQPEPNQARPFGLDDVTEPGIVAWAIHPSGAESIEDVVATMASAGFDPGPVAGMSRAKPDGSILSWRLTTSPPDGIVPFVIDWGQADSPAMSLPSMGGLSSFTVSHPELAVRQTISDLIDGVTVTDGEPGLAVEVATVNGTIRLV